MSARRLPDRLGQHPRASVLHRQRRWVASGSVTGTMEMTCPPTSEDASGQLMIVVSPSEARYRRVLDTLAVAIWEHDFRPVKAATEALRADGVTDLRRYLADHPEFVRETRQAVRITAVNETGLQMLGVTKKEEFFERLSDFLPEEDESFAECIMAIDENRLTFTAETRVRTVKGELIPIIVALKFPPDAGLDRISGSILDNRERLEMQAMLDRTRGELQHALRAASLGELATSIAHEVNQPLTAIMSYAQAAQRWLEHVPANIQETQKALARIVEATGRASAVIRHIRATARKTILELVPVALDETLACAIELVLCEAQAQCVSITRSLQCSGAMVSGDRVVLQQVFVSLLTNAIDALQRVTDRERRIRVETVCEESRALIWIIDSGPGFGDIADDRIFQGFYTTKAKGIGLGLAISRSAIEVHGGTIRIADYISGTGAAIAISLPLIV